MSNSINTRLMEDAADLMDYWTNTMWERLIQDCIDNNDLESLKYVVDQANKERAIQEDEFHESIRRA